MTTGSTQHLLSMVIPEIGLNSFSHFHLSKKVSLELTSTLTECTHTVADHQTLRLRLESLLMDRLSKELLPTDFSYYGFVYSTALPAGTYQVFVKPTWVTNDVPDYTMRTYFKESVTITQTPYTTVNDAVLAQGPYLQYSKLTLYCV